VLGEASDSFLEVLDRFTLADMVAERADLVRLLKIKPAKPTRAITPRAVN